MLKSFHSKEGKLLGKETVAAWVGVGATGRGSGTEVGRFGRSENWKVRFK